jgi:hypothetical protein
MYIIKSVGGAFRDEDPGIGLRIYGTAFRSLFFYSNLFARWVGGFELEMDVQPQALTSPYPIVPLTSPAPNS